MQVSLIIPAYNEQKVIKDTAIRCLNFLKENFEQYELIIVDDGSEDDTANELSDLDIILVKLNRNSGKGAAIKAGMEIATGDFCFFTDADLPYPLSFIKIALPFLSMGNCIVCGERTGKYSFMRSSVSFLYHIFARFILGVNLKDMQCGIKGLSYYDKNIIFNRLQVSGFAFDTEMLFIAKEMGMQIKAIKVPISHRKESRIDFVIDPIIMFIDLLKIRKRYKKGEYRAKKLHIN